MHLQWTVDQHTNDHKNTQKQSTISLDPTQKIGQHKIHPHDHDNFL